MFDVYTVNEHLSASFLMLSQNSIFRLHSQAGVAVLLSGLFSAFLERNKMVATNRT